MILVLAASVCGIAFIALAGLVYQRVGLSRDRRRFRPAAPPLEVAGRQLHFDYRGAGTPGVVLEAGLAATSLSWALVQRELASITSVCSYDRAGLGWSEGGRGELSLQTILEDLDAVIRANFPAQPVILVAHSFGGLLARAYACQRAEAVAALVLVDPVSIEHWAGCGDNEQRRLRLGAKLSRRGAWLAEVGVVRLCLDVMAAGHTRLPKLVARATAAQGSNLVNRLTGEMRRLPPELWPQVKAHWSKASSFRAMAKYLEGLPKSARGVQDVEMPYSIPVTILSAQSATENELRERDGWVATSVRGEHIHIADCGHWIQLQRPDAVVAAVTEVVAAMRTQNISFKEN